MTGKLVEVGTHMAGTTAAIAEALMILGPEVDGITLPELITCDVHFLNRDKGGKRSFYAIDRFREVMALLRKAHGREPPARMIEKAGVEAAKVFHDPISWCFLDGCHCRECVEGELAAFGPRILPGGFLLLHDCTDDYRGYPPDQRYHGDLRAFEVIEVAEEWEREHPEFEHVTTTPAKPMKSGKFFGGTRVLRRRA